MPAKDENFIPYTFDDCYDEEIDKEYMGKLRQLVLEDGNVVTIDSSDDPHGFWTVRVKKGSIPDHLKGSFTTFRDALSAVNRWCADRKRPIVYGITKNKPKVTFSREE